MRIRKRKVPLPLSLLSPIPLSDPNLFSRSPVMVVQQPAAGGPTTSIHSQPSDHFTHTSASDLRRLIFAGNPDLGLDEGVNDDASKANITTSTRSGAAPTDDNNNNDDNSNEFHLPLSNNAVGRWCDEDKAMPLKKRRSSSSFNDLVEDKNTTNNDNKDSVKGTITASNTSNNNGEVVVTKKGANNKRGNTIMEGSRCSRVNGRGWRCCQPTLVGYSLCEHHLGKGRLRSITIGSSGSNTSSIVKGRTTKKKCNSSNNNNNNNNVDEKKLEIKSSSVGNNKKVKLGVVKARSLSSLLGQTNTMEQHDKIISNMDHS